MSEETKTEIALVLSLGFFIVGATGLIGWIVKELITI